MVNHMIKILVAEDEEAIANLIRMNLVKAGYAVKIAEDGQKAADMLEAEAFDLCLFDIMLPYIDGYELLEYAKSLQIPVIFLTAKGGTMDKVKGLHLGADDYVSKPFQIIELLARVESVLRRYNRMVQKFQVLDMEIDVLARTVLKNKRNIDLTCKEFDLLLLFVQNPNMALYRETIYERVWGGGYIGESRTVDLHVQRLKKKLGLEQHIETIYKVGYRFVKKRTGLGQNRKNRE